MPDAIAERELKRFSVVQKRRETNWDDHYQEIAELYMTNRDFTVERTRGDRRHQRLFDATGIFANQQFAANIITFAMNPATKWVTLSTGLPQLDRLPTVQAYLMFIRDAMLQELSSAESSFYLNANETALDLGAFGSGAFWVGEEEGGQPIVFQSRPFSQMYFIENAAGIVDTVFRKYVYIPSQAIQAFEGSAPRECLDEWDKLSKGDRAMDKLKFVQLIAPNNDPNSPFSIASLHFAEEKKITVRKSGYFEMPIMTPRLDKVPGEVYGRSPAMASLPDLKMLQAIAAVVLRAAQKVADPPLQLPHDTFMGNLILQPGGVNYYRATARRGIEPLITGANPDVGLDLMDSYRQQILRQFYLVNTGGVLRPRGKTPPSAEQVADERQQRLQSMAPVITRIQREWLHPMLVRQYGVMTRQEMLPPPPPELDGIPLDIQFVSPAALAQRMLEAENIQRWVTAMAPVAQAKPSMLDNLDEDEFARRTHYIFDVHPDLLIEEDTVAVNRQQAGEAIRQQEQADVGAQQASAAKDTADAIVTLGENSQEVFPDV